MKPAWVMASWLVLGIIYGGSCMFVFLVGMVVGSRRATKALRRKLMIAGSRFA